MRKSYKMLRELNPWLNNDKIVNKANKSYTVRIPAKEGISLKAILKNENKSTAVVTRQ